MALAQCHRGILDDSEEEKARTDSMRTALSQAKEIEEQLTSTRSENYSRILEAESTINTLEDFEKEKQRRSQMKRQKKIAGGMSFLGAIAVGAMYLFKGD
mmetsp:Transcript_33684/g.33165  ORF Transcript_33684/g.33165 Transcript_33684/m.33165 type:complete len:100 (+) Transcript_33684:1227-1526(+)